jgi:tetratricopeptide (TPR) repeat protein
VISENLRYPGFYQEAAEVSDTLLQICVDHYRENGIYTALSLYNRAQMVRDIGLYDEAHGLYERALAYLAEEIDGENAHIALIVGDRGECERLQGRLSESSESAARSIDLCIKFFGENHIYVAQAKARLAAVLMDNESYGDATALLTNYVMPILTATVGLQHPLAHYVKGCIGICSSRKALSTNSDDGLVQIAEAYHNLKTYLHAPFPENHPWLVHFRPYVAESSEYSNDDTVHGSLSIGGNIPATTLTRADSQQTAGQESEYSPSHALTREDSYDSQSMYDSRTQYDSSIASKQAGSFIYGDDYSAANGSMPTYDVASYESMISSESAGQTYSDDNENDQNRIPGLEHAGNRIQGDCNDDDDNRSLISIGQTDYKQDLVAQSMYSSSYSDEHDL